MVYLCTCRVLEKVREADLVVERAGQLSTIPKSMSTLTVELDRMMLASGHESQKRMKIQIMPTSPPMPPQLPMIFSRF